MLAGRWTAPNKADKLPAPLGLPAWPQSSRPVCVCVWGGSPGIFSAGTLSQWFYGAGCEDLRTDSSAWLFS